MWQIHMSDHLLQNEHVWIIKIIKRKEEQKDEKIYGRIQNIY